MHLSYYDTINSLPSFKEEDLKSIIKVELKKINKTIIVLDDDPTGTQTMHHIPVLTVWDTASIEYEIKKGSSLFYILTNSRSLTAEKADELHRLIGYNIASSFEKYNRKFIIISRGDSTLRGHFPNDIIALSDGMGIEKYHTALIPAFFEGGRYTIKDIHYVKAGDELVPVAETAYAGDKAFGFSNSDLKDWIEEKSGNVIKSGSIISFSLETLRDEPTEILAKRISEMPEFSTCIVNAAAYYDVEKFSIAYLQSGEQMFFRTAASFVKAISGIEDMKLLTKNDLVAPDNLNGGLIVVGSYVSKSTNQLKELLLNKSLFQIEIDVTKILGNELKASEIVNIIEENINNGKDVVISTSRLLQFGTNEMQSLSIGNAVSAFITAIIAGLSIVPRFIIAKGGITSSDIATKSLGIKRAIVLGQALPGVPVWKTGAESKFPGLSYIIFPGNVGDDTALAELYQKLIAD